jgi:hypothetical protein
MGPKTCIIGMPSEETSTSIILCQAVPKQHFPISLVFKIILFFFFRIGLRRETDLPLPGIFNTFFLTESISSILSSAKIPLFPQRSFWILP